MSADRIKINGWDLQGTIVKPIGQWVEVQIMQLAPPNIPRVAIVTKLVSPMGALEICLELGTTIRQAEHIGQCVAAMLDSIAALPQTVEKDEEPKTYNSPADVPIS